jgi:hypothetical protein
MNTNNLNSLNRKQIPNIYQSDYEFNRFDKSKLKNNVTATLLSVLSASFSGWTSAYELIYNNIRDALVIQGFEVYIFIANPEWISNTKIAQYHKLSGTLVKKFNINSIKFLEEGQAILDNKIVFFGISKLSIENAKDAFRFISEYESGVLFACRKHNDSSFINIYQGLKSMIFKAPRDRSINLDIVDVINLAATTDAFILFPYSWEETGEYHLDIFENLISA